MTHGYICIGQNISLTTTHDPFLSYDREQAVKKKKRLAILFACEGSSFRWGAGAGFPKSSETQGPLPVAFLAGLAAGVSAAVPCLGRLLCGLCPALASAVLPHSDRHRAANGGCHFLPSEILPVILSWFPSFFVRVVSSISSSDVAISSHLILFNSSLCMLWISSACLHQTLMFLCWAFVKWSHAFCLGMEWHTATTCSNWMRIYSGRLLKAGDEYDLTERRRMCANASRQEIAKLSWQ